MSMLPGPSTMPDSSATAGSAQALEKLQVPLLGLASYTPAPRCTMFRLIVPGRRRGSRTGNCCPQLFLGILWHPPLG